MTYKQLLGEIRRFLFNFFKNSMLEISSKNNVISLQTGSKNTISFNTVEKQASIDGMNVDHPGEFEKSGILLEVKQYASELYYSFTAEGKHIVIISNDTFELKEEILSFFGDVDVLVIIGSQASAKIFENIEARLVVAYGEWKQTFLTHLGQHIEPVASYKIKSEFSLDSTEFVNLED